MFSNILNTYNLFKIIFFISLIFLVVSLVKLHELKNNNKYNILYLGSTKQQYSNEINIYISILWISVAFGILSLIYIIWFKIKHYHSSPKINNVVDSIINFSGWSNNGCYHNGKLIKEYDELLCKEYLQNNGINYYTTSNTNTNSRNNKFINIGNIISNYPQIL